MAIKIQNSTIIDDGRNIVNAGITTVSALNISTTEVISSARQLKNIASLDATTTATIETAIANAPNTFTDLNVTGVTTLANVTAGIVTATSFSGTATSTTNIPNLTGAITSNNTTTALGSFTSLQLLTALTDETGSGANVFANTPTLITPILGSASATSINASGIITATTFVGNLTGNLNSSGVNTATTISGTTATYTTGNITNISNTNINTSGVTTTTRLNVGTGGTVITTTASGFVGINTTAPGSTLAVGGTITELYAGQYWNVVTQADVGYGASQVPLNQYLGQLAFADDISPDGLRRDGGGSDDVTVNSLGFVGIGTTNAITLFQVGGGSSTVTINPNGNLGIGTTNPTSSLQVVGNASISGVITATNFFRGTTPLITGVGIGSTTVNPGSGTITNRVGTGFTDINIVGGGVSVTAYGTTIVLDFNGISKARVVNNFTATEGQTTFTISYVPGFVDVYLNGIFLTGTEFTASNGTSVILAVGASAGDILNIITYQSVSVGGPTGPIGPQGVQGAAGPQGVQGLAGAQGVQGAASTVPGPQGVQGAAGPQGVQGAASTVPGPQGVQGAVGPQGIQGAASTVPGPQGVQGLAGPQGVQGLSGPQGVQGAAGPQGVQGLSGPQGVQGAVGPQGVQGAASTVPGPQGVQGAAGPQGVQGAIGPSTTINAADDTATTTLYPVMVGATGSNQTAKARSTATAFSFNASTNILSAGGLSISKGSLGTTAGNTLLVSEFSHSNSNGSFLRIRANRSSNGTDWTTASTKLLQVIDFTEMGYVEYNPNGALAGMAFGSSATEWARFLSSGNLGVGNTNPQRKLHLRATGADGIFLDNTDQTGNTGGPLLRVRGQRVDGNTSQGFSGQLVLERWRMDASINSGQNLGAIIFGGNFDTLPGITTGITYGASIGAIAEGAFSNINTAPTAIVFNTGTVGLGTLALANVSYGTEAARITSNRNLLIGATTETGTASQRLQVTDGAYVSGNLGIGTTNPTSKLSLQSGYDVTVGLTAEVESNIKLNVTDNSRNLTIYNSSGNFGITEYYNSLSNNIIYHSNSSGVDATQYTSFGVGGAERLRIDAGGNILIGSGTSTGTASQRLQVTGGAYVSGNLGIGVTNPQDNLHVQGDLRLQADIPEIRFRSSDGTSNQYYIGANISNTVDGGFIIGEGSGVVGGTARLNIDTNGNVGINTSIPQYKLHVVGSFGATTKSFIIDHPTKEGKKLQYGSLESPYHGIRLTGSSVIKNGMCVIELPEYIHNLVKDDGLNINITNIKHGKVIWVEEVNVSNNNFVVMTEEKTGEYEFYWDFTAIRKDVEDLEVEF